MLVQVYIYIYNRSHTCGVYPFGMLLSFGYEFYLLICYVCEREYVTVNCTYATCWIWMCEYC